MIITKMTLEDLSQVLALEQAVFTMPWDEKGFMLEEIKHHYYLVAKEGNEILGYAVFFHILDEGEIHRIAVNPQYRRQGIGRCLLENIIIFSKALKLTVIHLEVRESNLKARSLYKSVGFSETGRRKGYYQKPEEDGILLTCPVI